MYDFRSIRLTEFYLTSMFYKTVSRNTLGKQKEFKVFYLIRQSTWAWTVGYSIREILIPNPLCLMAMN